MRYLNHWILISVLLLLATPFASKAETQVHTEQSGSLEVMEAFQQQKALQGENRALSDEDKRKIMFAIGVPLLILLLITAGLGIAMAIYGKQVFMAHMIFAGLSLTLALVHVVVGLVWFYPF